MIYYTTCPLCGTFHVSGAKNRGARRSVYFVHVLSVHAILDVRERSLISDGMVREERRWE
jgi:hypothetical protein